MLRSARTPHWIPAFAGMTGEERARTVFWIPAFAGMTGRGSGTHGRLGFPVSRDDGGESGFGIVHQVAEALRPVARFGGADRLEGLVVEVLHENDFAVAAGTLSLRFGHWATLHLLVIPAEAGIQLCFTRSVRGSAFVWTPAFVGVTE